MPVIYYVQLDCPNLTGQFLVLSLISHLQPVASISAGGYKALG